MTAAVRELAESQEPPAPESRWYITRDDLKDLEDLTREQLKRKAPESIEVSPTVLLVLVREVLASRRMLGSLELQVSEPTRARAAWLWLKRTARVQSAVFWMAVAAAFSLWAVDDFSVRTLGSIAFGGVVGFCLVRIEEWVIARWFR